MDIKLFRINEHGEQDIEKWTFPMINGETTTPETKHEITFRLPDGMSYEVTVQLMTLKISQILLCHKYVGKIDFEQIQGLNTGREIVVDLV